MFEVSSPLFSKSYSDIRWRLRVLNNSSESTKIVWWRSGSDTVEKSHNTYMQSEGKLLEAFR